MTNEGEDLTHAVAASAGAPRVLPNPQLTRYIGLRRSSDEPVVPWRLVPVEETFTGSDFP